MTDMNAPNATLMEPTQQESSEVIIQNSTSVDHGEKEVNHACTGNFDASEKQNHPSTDSADLDNVRVEGGGEGDIFEKSDQREPFVVNGHMEDGEIADCLDEPTTDVLGNGKLLKKTLLKGRGTDSRPTNGEIVTVQISTSLEDGTEINQGQTLEFTLGGMEVTNALDLCCCLMELDEEAEIKTDAMYAYGDIGLPPDIPPNAALIYKVKLENVKKAKPASEMSFSERLSNGDKKRENGNFLFARKDYSSAITCYTKALKLLDDSCGDESADQLRVMTDLRLKCFCNLAAAQLKIQAYRAAVESCDKVLRSQPDNIKAMYRKAKSLAALDDSAAAITILRQALKLNPQDKLLHSELSKLTSQQRQESEKQKELYQKMLGTKQQSEEPSPPKQSNHNWLWIGGAVAALLSISIAAYKFT